MVIDAEGVTDIVVDSTHELELQVTTSADSSPMAPSYSDISDEPFAPVPIEVLNSLEPDLESDSNSSMHIPH